MLNRTLTGTALSALVLTVGCSSLPERVETLDQAREVVRSLEQEPLTREVAPTRFETAQAALERAERSYEENEDLEIIEHDAYVALRNAQIAEQQIAEQRARDELQDGEAERNRVLLQAREREAERAQQLAEQRGEALSQQSEQLEQQEQQIQAAQQRAQQLEEERAQVAQEAEQLEQELTELQAEQTERGLILTLDEVLFDFDGAELKPGAEVTLQRVAEFLNEHPDRNLLIEGHTDAVGAETYNRDLSEQRAAAVREALVEFNIAPERVQTRGLGESFPVASNDTDAGRQLNRRVEIVISDQGGEFAEGAIRTAAIDDEGTTQ